MILKMQYRAQRVAKHACTMLRRIPHVRLGSAVVVLCTPNSNAHLAYVLSRHWGYYDTPTEYDEAVLLAAIRKVLE